MQEKKQVEFQPNEWLETLLRMQADEPKRFATLSPALKISVGYYERAKEKARQPEGKRAA
jgi:hypothetical protein